MKMRLKDGKTKVLTLSYDKKIVHNPSGIDVWVEINGAVYCVKSGETLKI